MRCGTLSILCAILVGCGARTDMGDPGGDTIWVDGGEDGTGTTPSVTGGSGGVPSTNTGATWVTFGGTYASAAGGAPFRSLGGATWQPLGGTTWWVAAGGRRFNSVSTWTRGSGPSYGGTIWTTRGGDTSYGGTSRRTRTSRPSYGGTTWWTTQGGATWRPQGGATWRPQGGATAYGGSHFGGFWGGGGYVVGGSYAWGGATVIGGSSSALGGYGNLVVQACVAAAQNTCQRCQCTECADEAALCLVDSDCLTLLQCAATNACASVACFLPNGACSAVLAQLGGLQSPSVQKGINMALCTVTARQKCGC